MATYGIGNEPVQPLFPQDKKDPFQLQSALKPAGLVAPAASQPSYEPYLKPSETVEGRLPGLLSQSNPLMESAKTFGIQSANKRGLTKSSLAAGEAQKAMINVALPIAQQDAGALATQRRDILGQQLQKGLLGTQYGFSSALSGQEFGQTRALQEAAQKSEMERLQTQLGGQKEMLGTEIAGRSSLSAQEATQSLAQQQAALDAESTRLTQQLAAQKENLLTELQGRKDLSAQEAMQQFELQSNELDAAMQQQLADIQAKKDLLAQQITGQKGISEQEFRQTRTLQGLSQEAEAQQLLAQIEAQKAMQQSALSGDMAKLQEQLDFERDKLSQDLAKQYALAGMEVGVRQQESYGSAIEGIGQAYTEQVATIQRDTTVIDKSAAISAATASYQDSVNMLSQIYGITVNWDVAGAGTNSQNLDTGISDPTEFVVSGHAPMSKTAGNNAVFWEPPTFGSGTKTELITAYNQVKSDLSKAETDLKKWQDNLKVAGSTNDELRAQQYIDKYQAMVDGINKWLTAYTGPTSA